MPKKVFNYPNGTDLVKFYQASLPRDRRINRKRVYSVVTTINNKILDAMLKERYEYRMPYRLGTLRMIQFKQRLLDDDGNLRKNKMKVDWASTKKRWVEESEYSTLREVMANTTKEWRKERFIFFTNRHTDGMSYCLKWSKFLAVFKNRSFYDFKILDSTGTKINKHVSNNEVCYIDTTNHV